MQPIEIQDHAYGVQPLSMREAEVTSGGNIFTDAYEGAKLLVEIYIVEPLREIVRQATGANPC